MKIEQTFACYRVVGTDYMIYRDVQNGKWGVAEEKRLSLQTERNHKMA